ncbi:MAG: hypothetical protein HKO62_09695 [Gammaproteobacteria bacterium]|nr:hypothetical protein [Gammaproteobacteria bacterium]NNM01011.1 hypothetical protein [Gammaproteobacteria bacterium]
MTQQADAASRYRVAVVTWLVVYPVITLLLFMLEPMMRGWPLPLRTLLLTAIMVPLLVFWALPAAHIRMRFFLQPDPGTNE